MVQVDTAANPRRQYVSPDQRSAEVHIYDANSTHGNARAVAQKPPEGFEIEQIRRNTFKITWEHTLREPATFKFGIEDRVETHYVRVYLLPNQDELTKFDADNGAEKGKTNDVQDT